MTKRTRRRKTVRQGYLVPPRRSQRRKVSKSALVIVIVLILIGLFVINRTRQAGAFHPHHCEGAPPR